MYLKNIKINRNKTKIMTNILPSAFCMKRQVKKIKVVRKCTFFQYFKICIFLYIVNHYLLNLQNFYNPQNVKKMTEF